jgi:GNAT superfamily N-acetyltransferase
LLQHAIEFAREKQFLRITLLTHRNDERLLEFYRQRGFVASDMMIMRMILAPTAGAGS